MRLHALSPGARQSHLSSAQPFLSAWHVSRQQHAEPSAAAAHASRPIVTTAQTQVAVAAQRGRVQVFACNAAKAGPVLLPRRAAASQPTPGPFLIPEPVNAYHQRSKHRPDGFAPGPGGLDWANQPDPFRRFVDCQRFNLPLQGLAELPPFSALADPDTIKSHPVNAQSVSTFLFNSLALSATKRAGPAEWHLRVNPSSGNLHPTEAYLLLPALGQGLNYSPALLHYCPEWHVLEQRATLSEDSLRGVLQGSDMLLVLTSIYWREAWKYGMRAFRYCNHDVGHALAAVRVAAAALGWQALAVHGAGDEVLGALCGLDRPEYDVPEEREHADIAVLLRPAAGGWPGPLGVDGRVELPLEAVRQAVAGMRWSGRPNELTDAGGHREWPDIDAVHAATREPPGPGKAVREYGRGGKMELLPALRGQDSISTIVRQRRSAVDMDRTTVVSREAFYRMLSALIPALARTPWDAVAWPVAVHLAVFVHRVEGLPSGLYLVIRDARAVPDLRQRIRQDMQWHTPAGCPGALRPHVFHLHSQDLQMLGKQINCMQDIGANGCFCLGMLADMRVLAEGGEERPWLYKRLFWETGMVGHSLYLEAELAGVRGTGIGCFFDDAFHSVLGLQDAAFQSLYHFSVGGPVDDPRLQTLDPYLREPRPPAAAGHA